MPIAEQRKRELIVRFEKGAAPREPHFLARPITATAGKIIGAALLVDTATFLGALVERGNALPSMIGCGLGLLIANTTIFDRSDVLDRARWRRYWRGDLLGYWLTYLPLLFALLANSDQDADPTTVFVGAYILASAVALLFGFANVCRRDDKDKTEIAQCLEEWRATAGTATN